MCKYKKISLLKAKPHLWHEIVSFEGKTITDRRLKDLGFVSGTKICVVGKGLFDTTLSVKIRNSTLCTRREQAKNIYVRLV